MSHFIWRLIRERLPTKVNLKRRNVELNDILCLFCGSNEEEVSHLFFNCDRILPFWWESLTWLNIKVVFPKSPRDHFLQHGHGYFKGFIYQRWQIWWTSLTWCIWFQRNKVIFENERFNGQKLIDDTIFYCWS